MPRSLTSRYDGPVSNHHTRFQLRYSLLQALAACLLLGVAGSVALVTTRSTPTRAPTTPTTTTTTSHREAIRVDCADRSVCTLASELALDVWSEEQVQGEPLDVVVDAPALERLKAAGAAGPGLDAG